MQQRFEIKKSTSRRTGNGKEPKDGQTTTSGKETTNTPMNGTINQNKSKKITNVKGGNRDTYKRHINHIGNYDLNS